MDTEDADARLEARPPLPEDLVALCRDLNREGARYVVLGGMAVIQAGFVRATSDIDLLIDAAAENQGEPGRDGRLRTTIASGAPVWEANRSS